MGSINMDLVLEVEMLPKQGETVVGKTVRYIPGGKGANQAVAASRLGAEVAIIGKIGNDHFGRKLLEFLKSEKLNVEGVTKSPLPTGLAIITVDKNGNNTIVYLSGGNFQLGAKHIEKQENLIKKSNLLLSTFETPKAAVEKLLSLGKIFNKTTMLNAAPAIKGSVDLFKKVDYLIVNETELSVYAGLSKILEKEDEIVKAARKVQSLGPKVVVVTIGARGAVTAEDNRVIRTEGIKVQAVDTTAAGDSFVGAMATQISNGVDLEEALAFANRAAAISVQKWGASSSLPTLKEFKS